MFQSGEEREGDVKVKHGRNDYLNRGADVVCRAAYELCRKAKRERDLDAKQLKDLCAVLKEAIGISLSLEKSADAPGAGVTVTFDDALSEYLG